ncbi:MAG: multidrug transporter [Herpetosiphon sp.]
MKQVVFRDRHPVAPFNEPARELRILNKPLWIAQRDLLARHCDGRQEVDAYEELFGAAMVGQRETELIAHPDSLFFDAPLIDTFITRARRTGKACQLAFALDDRAIVDHALRLQRAIRKQGDVYTAPLYYFPAGPQRICEPLVVTSDAQEMAFPHIPTYLTAGRGELVYQIPARACLSIEHWSHVIYANSPFGVFAWARRKEREVANSWWTRFRAGTRAALEGKQLLQSSEMVRVGKNCSIDRSAIIEGPTVLGDNVHVGAGAVIVSSMIGSNVTIMQGAQVMLSVISDRCYLPFNAGIFMSTLMDNTMVSQLSSLQLSVVGRNTFIGPGVTFADFDLSGKPIVTTWQGEVHDMETPVIGSAVGHNVKIGPGFVVYPGSEIDTGATLWYGDREAVVQHHVASGVYQVAPSPTGVQAARGMTGAVRAQAL